MQRGYMNVSKTFEITFLLDKRNDWIHKYVDILKEKLVRKGHEVVIAHCEDDIPKGDFLFLLGCTYVVSDATLSKNRRNLIVHESDLPRGRGMAPVTWQVLEGKNVIPIALLEATRKIDAGDIYLKDQIVLSGNELCDEIRSKQGEATVSIIMKFFDQQSDIKPVPQEGESTFYSRRVPEDSRLDPEKSISEQFNLLRVVDNERYPAFFEFCGKRYCLKIFKDNRTD